MVLTADIITGCETYPSGSAVKLKPNNLFDKNGNIIHTTPAVNKGEESEDRKVEGSIAVRFFVSVRKWSCFLRPSCSEYLLNVGNRICRYLLKFS